MRKLGRWFILPAVFLAAFSLMALAAGPGPVTLQEKDRGRTVTLQVGQKLILYLRNPASGGYHTLPPIFATAVLKLLEEKKLAPEGRARPRAGDFGQFYYEWQAKKKGKTNITINIKRPWEKKPPQEYWRVKVRVE